MSNVEGMSRTTHATTRSSCAPQVPSASARRPQQPLDQHAPGGCRAHQPNCPRDRSPSMRLAGAERIGPTAPVTTRRTCAWRVPSASALRPQLPLAKHAPGRCRAHRPDGPSNHSTNMRLAGAERMSPTVPANTRKTCAWQVPSASAQLPQSPLAKHAPGGCRARRPDRPCEHSPIMRLAGAERTGATVPQPLAKHAPGECQAHRPDCPNDHSPDMRLAGAERMAQTLANDPSPQDGGRNLLLVLRD